VSETVARRVVVAEDEALIRMDIVEVLRENGFDVVGEAADGEAAIELHPRTSSRPCCHGHHHAKNGRSDRR